MALVPTAAEAKPTAALIDLNRSPAVALLEAQLLTGELATWVERTEINRILDEKKLQTLFAPASGGERAKLGKMLKADVLVLVRSGVAEKVPYIEIVISEVSRGLRLVRRRVPLGAEIGQDVAELLKIVEQGFTLQSQPIQAIYAVPPFVSEDLQPEYDELKAAFSLLVEQRMQEHPGVVVVELAEAEALQRELLIAGDDAGIKRQMPTYLLGQYRNEGKDAERTIKIKLTLQQGEKQLGANQQTMKPEEASTYLREKTGNVVMRLTGKEVPPGDAKVEAAQLARRSKEFSKLGLWEDALAMCQASLLLDPKQPEMHHDAMIANTRLGLRYPTAIRPSDIVSVKAVAALFIRALDHHAAFYYTGGRTVNYHENGLNTIDSFASIPIGIQIYYSQEMKEFLRGVHAQRMEKCLALLHWQAEHGLDEQASKTVGILVADFEIGNPPPWVDELNYLRQKLAQRRKYIFELQHLPNAKNLTILLSTRSGGRNFNSAPFAEHLDALEKEGNQKVLDAVAHLRMLAARHRFDRPLPTTHQSSIPLSDQRIRLEPITLAVDHPAKAILGPELLDTLPVMEGLFAATPGLDVVWRHNDLYLMRKKGELKRVWTIPGYNQFVFPAAQSPRSRSGICCDGRFVWITAIFRYDYPRILVIDTTNDKIYEITHVDGLPGIKLEEGSNQNSPQQMAITSVAPGRIIAVGGFGRTWIAQIDFSPESGANVKLLHEAKTSVVATDREQWRDPELAFFPSHVFALEGPAGPSGKQERTLIISRSDGPGAHDKHPLLLNLDTLKVEVLQAEFRIANQAITYWQQDGAVYFVDAVPPMRLHYGLFRLTLPGPTVEHVCDLPACGYPFVEGKEFHLIGQQWLRGDWTTKRLRSTGTIPWSFSNYVPLSGSSSAMNLEAPNLNLLARSNHYGFVAQYGKNSKFTMAQVLFESAPTDPAAAGVEKK
ncbi:hypothetical protein [Anatilimnocola floriformis]|uniref:hypothetical protein n=1 Tax=Anatilimnocola floriformis TaxID=2948575 RepID=UPI0020C481D3|nr:hypothetical protein [Anatilimnocola floriformis]